MSEKKRTILEAMCEIVEAHRAAHPERYTVKPEPEVEEVEVSGFGPCGVRLNVSKVKS